MQCYLQTKWSMSVVIDEKTFFFLHFNQTTYNIFTIFTVVNTFNDTIYLFFFFFHLIEQRNTKTCMFFVATNLKSWLQTNVSWIFILETFDAGPFKYVISCFAIVSIDVSRMFPNEYTCREQFISWCCVCTKIEIATMHFAPEGENLIKWNGFSVVS